jgi:hypothetical protein
LAAAEARADVAENELAQTRAVVSCSEAMIQELKLEIAKLRRDKYGISSERRARLIDQLELQLEELEAAATEDALAAEQATEKACTVRARRKFFELADIAGNVRKGKPAHQISPVALEAVKRIDAIFDVEREINGLDVDARLAIRQDLSRPLVNNLHDWLQEERAKLSKHNKVAKAINYMFEKDGRWQAFTAFLDDGRICLTNNAAERALRGVPCVAWHWAESRGSSQVPSVAVRGRPPCIL